MWNISIWSKDHPDAYKWIEANGQWLYDNFDHCEVETSDDDDDARTSIDLQYSPHFLVVEGKLLDVEAEAGYTITLSDKEIALDEQASPLADLVSTREMYRAGLTTTSKVWTHMSKMAGCTSLHLNVYDMVRSIIPSAKRRTSDSIIIKFVMAASYFLWQERNERLFNNNKRTVAQVIECITASIRLKLISCRFKRSNRGLALLRRWKIPELVLEQNL
nr:hypothetical protein [Tanacetum cinerariifolium]